MAVKTEYQNPSQHLSIIRYRKLGFRPKPCTPRVYVGSGNSELGTCFDFLKKILTGTRSAPISIYRTVNYTEG